jgi:hypothetical protein
MYPREPELVGLHFGRDLLASVTAANSRRLHVLVEGLEAARERLRLWDRKPQAQKMPPSMGFEVVFKARARVEDDVVVKELDISRLQIHSVAQVFSRKLCIEEIEGLDLAGRKPWDLRKAILRPRDVVAYVAACKSAVAFPKDRHLEVGRFLRRLLALAAVHERPIQLVNQIGALTQHLVVSRK